MNRQLFRLAYWMGLFTVLLVSIGCVVDRVASSSAAISSLSSVSSATSETAAQEPTVISVNPVEVWIANIQREVQLYQQVQQQVGSTAENGNVVAVGAIDSQERSSVDGDARTVEGDEEDAQASNASIAAASQAAVDEQGADNLDPTVEDVNPAESLGESMNTNSHSSQSGIASAGNQQNEQTSLGTSGAQDKQKSEDQGLSDTSPSPNSTAAAVVPGNTISPALPPSPAVPSAPGIPFGPTVVSPQTSIPNTSSGSSSSDAELQVTAVSVTLVVLGPTGQQVYQVSVADGSTVEEVMVAAQAQGFTMELRSFGGMGSYVTSINGIAEDIANRMSWIYRINGEKAVMGISSALVHGGETIQWVYEKIF